MESIFQLWFFFLETFAALKISAWSILAETEEPTVLTPKFGNRNEPEPKFWQNWNPFKNRNRRLGTAGTRNGHFRRILWKILIEILKFEQFWQKLNQKTQKMRDFDMVYLILLTNKIEFPN